MTGNLLVRLGLKAEEFIKGLNSANKKLAENKKQLDKNDKQIKRFGTSLKKLKANWMAVGAATAGTTLFMKKSVSAYMEQEKAIMKLAVAMKNQGDYTRNNLKGMERYASQLQKITTYGDEVTLSMMGNLKTYGMNTEELKKATLATMNLASAKGMDLVAASDLVGKAFVGETGSLSRYGIVLEKGIEKSEKFAEVLKLINDRFGGAAQAEIETYSGQLKQMSNWWGDITEKIGVGLLKALEAVQFAFGMVAAGFYATVESMYKGLEKLVWIGTKIPLIGRGFRGLKEDVSDSAKTMENMKNKATEFALKNYDMMKSFDKVDDAISKMGETHKKVTKKMGDDTDELEKKMNEHAEKIEEVWISFWENYDEITSSELENEIRKLDKKYDEWREHLGDLAELNEAYEIELGKIYDKHGAKAIKVINEIEDATEEAAKKTEELWIHALENVQDTTADLFYDIFDGALDGWEDVTDKMKDYFKRMLADMAAQALMNPIIVPMMQNIGGTMGLPGMAGQQETGYLAGFMAQEVGGQQLGQYAKGGMYGAMGYSALAEPLGMPTGTEATIGAGIGGALGTLIPIPVLGTALGAAAGGAIGSLFSSEERAYIGAQFEVGWDEGFDVEKIKEWAKGVGKGMSDQATAQIEETITSTLGAYEEIYGLLGNTQQNAMDQSLEALGDITFGEITKGSTQEKLEKRFNTHLEQMMDEMYDTIGALFQESLKDFAQGYVATISGGIYGENITGLLKNISGLAGQEKLTAEELYELANSLQQVEQAVNILNTTWENTQYEIDIMTGSVSELDQKLHDINIQFDNWSSTMESLGASQSVLAEIETERADAIEYATKQYQQSILSGAYSAALSAMQPAINLYNSLQAYQTEKERAGWGITEYTDLLAEIATQIENLDENSSSYYDDSLALISNQFEIVKEIERLQAEIASSLIGALSSITDIVEELTIGSLAPVQSMEAFQNTYNRLISTITTSDDPGEITQAVSDLSSYMSDYMSFMGAYGGDYATLTESVLSDLGLAQNAIITAGLENIGTSFADMIPELNWDDYISDPEMAAYFANLQAIEANTASTFDALTSDSSSYLVEVIAYLQTQVSQMAQLIAIATLMETGAITTAAQAEAAGAAYSGAVSGGASPVEALEAAWEAVTSANVVPTGAPIFSVDDISSAWTGTTQEALALLTANSNLKNALESVASMEGADYSSIQSYFTSDLASKTNRTFAGGHGWSFETNGQWTDIDIYRKGGLARRPGIIGERGPEWAVPTYEPERTSFLRDVGADPEEIGESIARRLYPLLSGKEENITIQLNIDGQPIKDIIVKGLRGDSEMINAVRRLNG